MSAAVILGAWVAVGLTLMMYSFLYRDNPLFKLAEHLYVGVTVGYTLTLTIFKALLPKWYEPLFLQGHLVLLVPTAIGLLTLTRLIPSLAWLSRLAFAFIVGFASGVAIPRIISSNLLGQVQGTVAPLISRGAEGLRYTWADLSALVVLLGVLSVLTYFFFSVEHKGPIRAASRIGIAFLMISFGASFGYNVMARVSLLYGRFFELYTYRTADYYYATPVLLAALAVVSLVVYLRRRGPKRGSAL